MLPLSADIVPSDDNSCSKIMAQEEQPYLAKDNKLSKLDRYLAQTLSVPGEEMKIWRGAAFDGTLDFLAGPILLKGTRYNRVQVGVNSMDLEVCFSKTFDEEEEDCGAHIQTLSLVFQDTEEHEHKKRKHETDE